MTTKMNIPEQRTTDVKPKRVITTFVVCLTLDESMVRHMWRGKTEDEIIESINSETLDDQIQEFVDEIQATSNDDKNKMIFVRTVRVVER